MKENKNMKYCDNHDYNLETGKNYYHGTGVKKELPQSCRDIQKACGTGRRRCPKLFRLYVRERSRCKAGLC